MLCVSDAQGTEQAAAGLSGGNLSSANRRAAAAVISAQLDALPVLHVTAGQIVGQVRCKQPPVMSCQHC